jgi:hypothetical protein
LAFVIAMAATLSATLSALAAAPETRPDLPYPPPLLTVPHVPAAPTIDGVIDDAEWARASQTTGFHEFKAKVLAPQQVQTTWWFSWDDEHLYLACRYPLFPEGTILATQKSGDGGGSNPDAGSEILRGDHLEIRLATILDRKAITNEFFFQFLVNPYGAIEDARVRQSEGWPGLEWQSEARVGSKVQRDRWEIELAIPLKNLELPLPLGPRTSLIANFVAAADPEQFYTALVPHSWKGWVHFPELVLDRSAPAVRLLSLGALMEEGKLDARVEVIGSTAIDARASLSLVDSEGKSALEKTQPLRSDAGKPATADFQQENLKLPRPANLSWSIHDLSRDRQNLLGLEVTAGDKLLFRQHARFCPRPDDLDINWLKPYAQRRAATSEPVVFTAYYPTYNQIFVNVDLDVLGMDERFKQAVKAQTVVERAMHSQRQRVAESAGLRFAEGSFDIPATGMLQAQMPVAPLEPGQYLVTTTLLDAKGKAVHTVREPMRRHRFEWENNTLGKATEPIPPYQPIKVGGSALQLWGREIRLADTALPQTITTQGRAVLASPPSVTATFADGSTASLKAAGKLQWVDRDPGRTVAQGEGELGALRVATRATTEYDGLTLFDLTFIPAQDQPVEVRKIDLVLDVPRDVVNCFLTYNPAGSVGPYGGIPEKTGVFWNSQQLIGTANIAGRFLPYLYLGDGELGLTYFANSDQGWMLDRDQPSATLENTGDTVRLTLHLANRATRISKPRTLTFGLQAVPTKRLPPDYRISYLHPKARGNENETGFLSGYGAASWTASGTGPGLDAITMRDDLEYEILRDQLLAYRRSAWPDYDTPVIRYSTTNIVSQGLREFETYAGEWSGRTTLTPKPMPGYLNLYTPFGQFTDKQATRQFMDICPSSVDLRVWALDQHQRRCGLNGYHWDHTPFWSSGSLLKGTAYVDDDGSVQGTLNLLLTRDLLKRMAVVSHANAVRLWQGRYAPIVVAAENFATRVTCIEDVWYCKGYTQLERFGTLARYRARCARYTGLAVYHFPSTDDRQSDQPVQTRSVVGLAMLHDVAIERAGSLHRGTIDMLMKAFDEVSYFDAATTWTPYWRNGDLVQTGHHHDQVAATVYRRGAGRYVPAAALVVLFNATDASVRIAPKLNAQGLVGRDDAHVLDGETLQSLEPAALNNLDIARHDFRLLIVQ